MRFKIQTIFFVSLAVFFVALGNAHATNWYVDKDSNGSNNGTSWLNAWRTFSDIKWSTTWSPDGVAAGDTLYISGGTSSKIYTEKWTVGASGTDGNPITITVDKNDPNHSGQVIFDYSADGSTASSSALTISNRSYIVIDGVDDNRRIKFRNLYNTENKTLCYSITSASTSATNVTIKYVEFENVNHGPRIIGVRYVEVSYCKFTAVRGDGAITVMRTGAEGWSENSIHHNDINLLANETNWSGPDGIQGDRGTDIFNNTIKVTTTPETTSTQHCDMIQWVGDYGKIYNNTFINVADSSVGISDNEDVEPYFDPTVSHVYVYNNVFLIETAIDTWPEFIRLFNIQHDGATMDDILIANNTFVDNDSGSAVGVVRITGNKSTISGDVTIKNNIFYNCGNGVNHPILNWEQTLNNVTWNIDNNIYYGGTDPHMKFKGITYTIAKWIASVDTEGSSSQPLFTSYVKNNPEASDYTLQIIDTVAKDHAISLSNYFTTDKNNVNRPTDFWDIGAYQATKANISKITAPKNFVIQ